MMWRLRFGRPARSRVMDLPKGKPDAVPDFEIPPPPSRTDWPRIQSSHPNWWQVHRVEVHGTERNYVLIAEVRSEERAYEVAALQLSQVRIRKWGVKERDYYSFQPPLVR